MGHRKLLISHFSHFSHFKPLLLLTLLLWGAGVLAQNTLHVGTLGINSNQRYVLDNLIREFEKEYPQLTIKLTTKSDNDYKTMVVSWLKDGNGPDVFAWQGGERLYQFVRTGKIHNIESLWQANTWSNHFIPSAQDAVRFQGAHYGVPISIYSWGVYYRRSIFKRLGLSEPATWNEFLHITEQLKNADFIPLSIGTKDQWTAAAWFSHLTVRIHGKEFYQTLISGKVSFEDKRTIEVFNQWRELLKREAFPAQHDALYWNQALPPFFRGHAAMILSGDFLASQIPPNLLNDIGYFGFPEVSPGIPITEHIPTDIFVIPSYSENKNLAEKFLTFIARSDIQKIYNTGMGTFSANIDATHISGALTDKIWQHLKQSDSSIQFLDRDTPDKVHKALLPILVDFMKHAEVQKTTQKLEALRAENLFQED